MRTWPGVLLLLLSAASAKAQSGPAIAETTERCEYTKRYRSIKDVRFRDLQVTADGHSYQLRDGKYHHDHRPEPGQVDVSLDHQWLIRDAQGAPTRAVINLFVLTCGGSCSPTSFVQVFALEDGKLTLKQELRFQPDAEGCGVWFEAHANRLLIVARSEDGTSNCCPEHVDHASYEWRGDGFRLVDWKTVPLVKKPAE